MPTTATYAFPYPGTGDSPHGPNQIQALAQAVEDKIELVDGSAVFIVASTASVSAPYTDQLVFSKATKCFHRWTGAAWVVYYPGVQNIHKSATEQITNNTLQNDDHFAFSVVANAIYELTGYVLFNADPAVDINCAFTGPAGATLAWTNFTNSGPDAGTNLTDLNTVVQALGTARKINTLASGVADFSMPLQGTLVTGANAGTLNFQWAQAVTNGAQPARVLINSRMKLIRMV